MKDANDCYFPVDLNGLIPACKEVKYMLHLVAYDISDSKRLRRISRICLDYGIRVEYSVFECDLPAHRFKAMWQELNAAIVPDEDALLAYILCETCVARTLVAGTAARSQKPDLYIM